MYVIFHLITSVIQHTFIDFILSLVSKSLRDYNFLMLVLPCCMSKCSVKQSCRALQETNRSIYFSFLNVIEVISNITIFYLLKIASSYQHFPSLCTDFMDKIGRTFFFFFFFPYTSFTFYQVLSEHFLSQFQLFEVWSFSIPFSVQKANMCCTKSS